MKKNVLITGSCGFIGYFVCLEFLKNNYRVFGVDNLNDYYSKLMKNHRLTLLSQNKGYTHLYFDLSVKKDVKFLFDRLKNEEIEYVVHLAAYPGVQYSLKNPQKYIKNNIVATQNLFDFINKHPYFKKNIILASTSSVYTGNPLPFNEDLCIKEFRSPYAYTKFASENIARFFYSVYDFNVVVLRYFTVYGPLNRPDMAVYKFFESILKGKTIYVRGKDIERDFTYVEDAAKATFQATKLFTLNQKVFEIINIGSDNPIKVLDLIKVMFEVAKKETKVVVGEYASFEPVSTWANIEKARKLLNFSPSIDLYQNLLKTFRSLEHYWNEIEGSLLRIH